MPSYYWLKLYYEILDDPKMGRLSDRMFRRTIELFLLAGEEDKEGSLPTVEDMSWRLRMTEDDLQTDLADLASLGIVHKNSDRWVVTNFAKRQAKVSDAERMRQYRERQKKQEYYGDSSDTVTIRNTDIDIDIDIEEEGDAADFTAMRDMLETLTGCPSTPGDIPAIEECVSLGVLEDDIAGALGWRVDNDRQPVKTIAQLLPGIITNRSIRVQEANATKGKNGRPKKRRNQGTLAAARAELEEQER